MHQLSLEAKTEIIRKALNLNAKSREELAGSLNIGYSTLQKWVKDFRDHNGSIGKHSGKEKFTPEQRFHHLLVTDGLDESAKNRYCREHGLYSFQLAEWKKEFMTKAQTPKKTPKSSDLKALKAEMKALKRELNRKDKALAETAALLVLKKKADLIWGDNEDV